MPKMRSLSMHFRYCVKCIGGGLLDVVFRFGVACRCTLRRMPPALPLLPVRLLLCCVRYSDNPLFLSPRAPLIFSERFRCSNRLPQRNRSPEDSGAGGVESSFRKLLLFVLGFPRQNIAHRTTAVSSSFLIVGVIGQDFAHNGRK